MDKQMDKQMTQEEWDAMREGDYAPNPTPEWIDYATGIVMLVLGMAVGGLFTWFLFEAFKFFAEALL